MAAPPAKAAVQMPMARARSAGCGNMLAISERLAGIRVAPPMPISARAPMRNAAFGAKAAATEAMPKTAAPISRMRRRPIRSPRLPMVISRPAIRKP